MQQLPVPRSKMQCCSPFLVNGVQRSSPPLQPTRKHQAQQRRAVVHCFANSWPPQPVAARKRVRHVRGYASSQIRGGNQQQPELESACPFITLPSVWGAIVATLQRMAAVLASTIAAALLFTGSALARTPPKEALPIPAPDASNWADPLLASLPYVAAVLGGLFVFAAIVAVGIKVWRSVSPKMPSPPISQGCQTVRDALKQVYFAKVRPLEEEFGFSNFYSPLLTAGDFNAKPSVLLLGQYSTGKTTFIKHLIKRDYPGILIGPEPTTDRFVVIGYGEKDARIPGNTAVITSTKPYQALATYGEGFLSRFEEVQCNHELLQGFSLIDTPGVLSGEKQRLDRAYNFIDVCAWFASRSDMVLLLFDPFKLDISDEFRQVIETLRDHHDKIRVVLNKADQVSSQELMRVYGALMWSLAKVLHSPEVTKVYTGSFADDSMLRSLDIADKSADAIPIAQDFFEKEQADLLRDLEAIPRNNRDRKIGEFTKRVRAAKTHLILVHNLRRRLPWIMKEWAEEHMLANLEYEFARIKNDVNLRLYELAPGDFPSAQVFRATVLSGHPIRDFPWLSAKAFERKLAILDDVLLRELPHICGMHEK